VVVVACNCQHFAAERKGSAKNFFVASVDMSMASRTARRRDAAVGRSSGAERREVA
jgi:hypothetical protein